MKKYEKMPCRGLRQGISVKKEGFLAILTKWRFAFLKILCQTVRVHSEAMRPGIIQTSWNRNR